MPRTVADYVTAHNIDDSMRALPIGGGRGTTYEFHMPKDLDPGSRSVLAFMVQTEDADDLHFTVRVNDHPPSQTYTVNSEVLRSIHEIIGPSVLKDGDKAWSENSVEFKLTSGDGTLRIGDVVLWFQRHD